MRYFITLLLAALSLNAVGQVPSYVSAQGLEAWWPFNGDATDESPNGHDGVVNGAVLTTDRYGVTDNAYFFDGSNDNITVDILFDEPERSFFAWFNSAGSTGTNQIVFLNDHNQLNNGHSAIAFDDQTLVLQAGTMPCGNQALEYNTWYHAGAVRSNESTMYYFNGDLLCTMPNENIYSSLGTFVKLILGSTHVDRFFFGEIDDVGIWNRALSEEEIQALYIAEPPVSGCTDEEADNYNSEATDEDGTCEYLGCTNPSAENYDSTANVDDGSCIILGCIDSDAANYNSEANQDIGSCLYDLDYVNHAYDDGVDSVICPENICPADLDESGYVSTSDLLLFLVAFGEYCDVLDACGVINGDGSTCADQCGDPIEHDGYDYATMQIGDQCWFAENCRYLPVVSPSSVASSTSPYYYVYGYEGSDVAAAQATDNYATYGVLYNWPAVMTEGICPSGWHIPSDGEWQTMEMSLGMCESDAASTSWRGSPVGDYLKSTSGWNSGGNGTNSSGFNGLPGGFMSVDDFGNGGHYGYWWSTSESNSLSWFRALYGGNDDVARDENYREYGFSARCLKD